jgi:hypothetical protein
MSIDALKELTESLIWETIKEIGTTPDNAKEDHYVVARYYLSESQECMEGVWPMLAESRFRAALALSRWVLEAALNLIWAVADDKEVDQRLQDLRGKALYQEAALRDELAEASFGEIEVQKEQAEKARSAAARVQGRPLGALEDRVKSLQTTDVAPKKLGELGPKLYAYYRICSTAIHAHPRVWEHPQKKIVRPWVVYLIATLSPFYLVGATHVLTGTGDLNRMYEWWTKAESLLDNTVSEEE